jgi:hypothetical protein
MAIECEDVEILMHQTTNTKVVAAIQMAISVFFRHEQSEIQRATALGFRRITMEEQRRKIGALLQYDEYNTPILEHFTKFPDYKLGVVVEIITLSYMKKGNEKMKDTDAGFRATASGEAIGAPGVNSSVEVSRKVTKHRELSGTYTGEVIVACGYLQLSLPPAPSSSGWLSWWKSTETKLKIDDIVVSTSFIHPKTMTLALPPTRIPGNAPTLLGAHTQEQASPDATARGPETEGDDDLDFWLYDVFEDTGLEETDHAESA